RHLGTSSLAVQASEIHDPACFPALSPRRLPACASTTLSATSRSIPDSSYSLLTTALASLTGPSFARHETPIKAFPSRCLRVTVTVEVHGEARIASSTRLDSAGLNRS